MDAARHDHIRNLRRWRDGDERDLSLAFVSEYVKKQVVRPHQQLGKLGLEWRRQLPAHLLEQTALVGISRGVLTVHAADSAALYELDRLLRAGVERKLKAASDATLRRIKLTVGPV